jgi:FkbM family methyltransferase
VGNEQVVLGNYEPEVKNLLYLVIGKFTSIVNVGANHGYYLCLASKMGFRDLIGVEPLRQNIRILNRNLRLNHLDSVKIVKGACGSPNDQSLVLFGSGTGASYQEGWGGAKSKIKRLVPVFALDSLVNTDSEPCVFIIDVEGYESKVLDGSENLLTRECDIWLVEISFYENRPDGILNPDALKILQRFTSAGFSTFAWYPTLQEIRIKDSIDLEQFANIFHIFLFVKKSIRANDFLELIGAVHD